MEIPRRPPYGEHGVRGRGSGGLTPKASIFPRTWTFIPTPTDGLDAVGAAYLARRLEKPGQLLDGPRTAIAPSRRERRGALARPVEAFEVVAPLAPGICRREAIARLAIPQGIALVGAVEVEGVGA